MSWVGFEPTIPASERAKTVHVLGRPYTNCVKRSIKTWDQRNKSWRQHHDSDRCVAVFIISFVSTVLLSLRHVADIVSWLLHVLTHAGVRPTLDCVATVTAQPNVTLFNLVPSKISILWFFISEMEMTLTPFKYGSEILVWIFKNFVTF
jgi:hypothetical protein